MTLKDLQKITNTLIFLNDFIHSNTEGDESGIVHKLASKCRESMDIIDNETYRICFKNELAKQKRKLNL